MLMRFLKMIILQSLVINALMILPVLPGQQNIVGEMPINLTRNNNPSVFTIYPMIKPEREKIYPRGELRPSITVLPNGPIVLLPEIVDLFPIEEPRITYPQYIVETPYSDHQGDNYPEDEIKTFLDDNKAMVRRMYGSMNPINVYQPVDEYSNVKYRYTRQTTNTDTDNGVNFCPSLKEISSPFWAYNNTNYKFAVVNYEPFTQAVHVEKCLQAKNCGPPNCRCTQDYTWHRLLAYDPSDNCRGIFMEWFKFPSCCVCKCF